MLKKIEWKKMPGLHSRLFRFLGFSGYPTTSSYDNTSSPAPAPIRIGILGAANIAPFALIYPSRLNRDTRVTAVAARDEKRAKSFAKKYNIEKTFTSYEELLADKDIDAVYIPSPNGLHFRWAIKALEAGKHVLCEKPITSNAEEARELVEIAKQHKRVLMEAAHCFHHPSLIRAREIVRSGRIGEVTHVSTEMMIPLIPNHDIRYDVNGTQRHLAGGAFMDTGVYVSHCARFFTDLNFGSCTEAKAKERFPGVDESMQATVTFENSSVTGEVRSTMALPFPYIPKFNVEVKGTKGSLRFYNFVGPHVYHRIYITDSSTNKTVTETCYGEDGLGRSTYEYQLEAFVKCVREQEQEGGPAKTKAGGTVDDFVGTMEMLDAIYEKSGLGIRYGVGK